MSGRLDVWLYGRRIAVLGTARGGMSLEFAADLPPRSPMLSTSLPTQSRPLAHPRVESFFEGLLPEGAARAAIADEFDIDDRDIVAMLATLGRDCAGALVIVPEGEPPPAAGAPQAAGDEEIARRLSRLATDPLGVGDRVRLSLAGVQSKLLLCRIGAQWALPVDGAPSTHILKPAIPALAHSVHAEALCLAVLAELDVAAATCAVEDVDGVTVLAVERFDREIADAQVARIHQEDFCQALGIRTRQKYEDAGGPGFRQCAALLKSWAPRDLLGLVDLMVLNAALGNPDAHGKNLSLLHLPDGEIRLAPAYDIVATLHDSRIETKMAMSINGESELTRVTAGDCIAEATAWGVKPDVAATRVESLLARLPGAVQRAQSHVRAPDDVVAAIDRQLARLASADGRARAGTAGDDRGAT